MAIIKGGSGNDELDGTGGADTISGRGGNDRLRGLAGADRLLGEAGNDILDGGRGDDSLDGGRGLDLATYVDLASGVDVLSEGNADFADGLAGDWFATSAAGGSDILTGIEGIVGTRFADDVRGDDDGAELIRGGSGDDFLAGGYYSLGSDTIYGGAGNDIVLGGEEIVSAGGTYAGRGDRFYGGDGNDRLGGLDGSDRLFGENGNDYLSGGPDRDVLTGGAGADTFAYLNNLTSIGTGTTRGDFGADLIADFRRGTDEIRFEALQRDDDGGPPSPSLAGFADLDSNGNGLLDGGDAYVDVERVTFGGSTRTSTVIDVTAYVEDVPGEQSLTIFGVTGLTAADFTNDL